MKAAVPFLIVLLAIVATALSIASPSGLPYLNGLKAARDKQQEENSRMAQYVDGLKNELNALKNDDRALEKKARDELGMARENELLFFFERAKK